MKELLIVLVMVLFSGCTPIFPKVPTLMDQEEKTCTYYLYHKHYEGEIK